jgi:hypothetical protein
MTYLTEAPKPTAAQLEKIEQLQKQASDALRRKEESWERSDTDGFLSQWANGMTAQLNDAKVAILKNGGYARFRVLCDGDGNVVATKIYHFTNSYSFAPESKWRLPDSLADGLGRKWIPTGDKSRVQKQLGLHEESRWFPAYAEITGGGKGLGGAASCYVGTFQKTDRQVAA